MHARLITVTFFVAFSALLSPAGAGPISRQNKPLPPSLRPSAGILSGAGLRAAAARRFISDVINGTKSDSVNNFGGGSDQVISVDEFRSELLAPADDTKAAVRNRLFPNDATAEEKLLPVDSPVFLALRRFQQLNSGEFYSVNFIELRWSEIELRNIAISMLLLDRVSEMSDAAPAAQLNVKNLVLAIEAIVSEMTATASETLERVEDPREREQMQKTYLTMFETVLASSGSAAWSAALRAGHTGFDTRLHELIADKFQIARAKLNTPPTISMGVNRAGKCSVLFDGRESIP